MGWRLPPPDVQARVAGILGDGFWPDFEASWQRVAAIDPGVNITEWYRPPDVAVAMHRAHPLTAALYTQHGAATAIDFKASNLALRQRMIEAATREHFFVRTGPTPSTTYPDLHVHIAALSDAAYRRSQLLALVRRNTARFLGPLER